MNVIITGHHERSVPFSMRSDSVKQFRLTAWLSASINIYMDLFFKVFIVAVGEDQLILAVGKLLHAVMAQNETLNVFPSALLATNELAVVLHTEQERCRSR